MDNLNDKRPNEAQRQPSLLGDVSGSAKPPLGLIPKKFHDDNVKLERFKDVCGAITRYYSDGRKIDIEWILEYNELIDDVSKQYH